mgnify:CR=1 FL=1
MAKSDEDKKEKDEKEELKLTDVPGIGPGIAAKLEAAGTFNRKVNVQVPYHSHHIEPIKSEMLKNLSKTKCSKATLNLYSTVTGKQESGTHLSAKYWYQNARQCVLFTDALSAMITAGHRLAGLEIQGRWVDVRDPEVLASLEQGES